MKVKLIFEVRDIWPLTLTSLGGYSKYHPFIIFSRALEKIAYKLSDNVVSNLPFAYRHMVRSGMKRKKFHWIPNGFDFDSVREKNVLPNSILELIDTSCFSVVYTGSVGIANHLDVLIKAADILKDDKSIKIYIVGDGQVKNTLKKQCESLNLSNVIFIDPLPKPLINSLLNYFDVCYLGWGKHSLYEFGIAPNKLPEYMYASKPVIHSFSGKGDIVRDFCAGLSVPAEAPTEIANAIKQLKTMPESERLKLGSNGKNGIVKHFSYQHLAEKYLKIMQQK